MTAAPGLDTVPALSPASAVPGPEDALPEVVLGSLSPSRAADFKACPLLYRFRCVDRLPEARSAVATRGTLVHAVLERLFDLPAAERTLESATRLLPEAWERVRTEDPDVLALFPVDGKADGTSDGNAEDSSEFTEWLASAAELLGNYFRLEDPRRIEPESRELSVDVVVDGVRLRGVIDRIDVAPTGEVRVVDYKTGASPREAFEGKALFQMKFYALVLWRTRGVLARQLRLMYLSDTDTLTYEPEVDELLRFEQTLLAIWRAIQRALQTGDFRPSPSRLCDWCDHRALCPAFGGTPPPYPQGAPLTDPRDVVTPPGSAAQGDQRDRPLDVGHRTVETDQVQ